MKHSEPMWSVVCGTRRNGKHNPMKKSGIVSERKLSHCVRYDVAPSPKKGIINQAVG